MFARVYGDDILLVPFKLKTFIKLQHNYVCGFTDKWWYEMLLLKLAEVVEK